METKKELKKVVCLRDLAKIAGTVADYEYHIDDDDDVEIRIRNDEIPSDKSTVENLSIINTRRSNASVTVYCDKGTDVNVHSTYSLRIVRVCRKDVTILAKTVSTLMLGRSIYNTKCDKLVVKLNNSIRSIHIIDSAINYLSAVDKVVINGSVIHSINILEMEVDIETSIKYINDKRVLCMFTYGKDIVMVTDEAFFVNGEEYDLDKYKNNEVYKDELLPVIKLISSKKRKYNEYDAETLNDAE